jgi:hypothetical protein
VSAVWLLCCADYVLLCIDALCGVTRITREHLAVAVALEVPTALVITKADAADARQLQSLLQQLRQLMAPLLGKQQQQEVQVLLDRQAVPLHEVTPAVAAEDECQTGAAGLAGSTAADTAAPECCDGVPVVVTEQQAVRLADALSELHSCTAGAAASFRQVTFPVFTVSCVTGAGLSLLHAFLSRLQPVSTNRSSRQCGTAAAAAASSDGVVTHARARDAGMAAAVELQETQQQKSLASSSSSSKPWIGSYVAAASDSGGVATAAADAEGVQRQLLDMEGSSSLWVAKQLTGAAEAATSCSGSSAAAAGAAAGAGAAAEAPAEAEDAGAAAADAAGHFQVVHTYDVEGVGWVVSGIAVSGECRGMQPCCALLICMSAMHPECHAAVFCA